MRKTVTSLLLASSLGAAWALPPQLQLDSLHASLDTLSGNMESTLLGKDDLPLAVSGYMAFRLKNFHYSERSPWVQDDKARTSVDAILNVNVVAMPNSYITLFTNLMFPFDLSGIFTNNMGKHPTEAPGNYDERVLFDHSTDYYASTINEEMNVGVDIRAGVFGAYITAGGVIWANASPLTMWERETNPRFVWQYELFEDEKTVSTYYKEKAFKPVKEGGRAFWTNRSFGGVFANFYQLPYDMKAQFLVSQPIDADVATRDGLRMYGGQPGELEMSGGYDFRGTVLHGRVAKEKIADNLTVGVNYMGVTYDKGSVFEDEFRSQWNNFSKNGLPVLLNTHVITADVKGNVTPKLFVMGDVGVSITDSTIFVPDPNAADYSADPETGVANNTSGYSTNKQGYRSSVANPKVGVYVKAQSKYVEGWPMTAELVFFQPGFYSPYSLTNPSRFTGWRKDETYLNAGALRYSPNMAGINFKLEPSFNRGYFDFQYAQHRQIDPGLDVIAFNYRLNGRNMWESSNSWTKHKPLFVADSGNASGAAYISRAGAHKSSSDGIKGYRQRGGLYGGTWEMWESFAAFENGNQVAKNQVPMHAKWSSYLSFMGGYDIGHWIGTERNVMLTGYFAFSGISTSFAPIAVSEKQSNMLMTSFYGQIEPTVAVTPTFHMVGILGMETFRSDKAYMFTEATNIISKPQKDKPSYFYEVSANNLIQKAPINYRDFAIGLGFDWDFSDRVGLHFRYKFMTHSDETVSDNNWHSHYIAAETKAWF
ncbi:hypothetical protein [Fibrobacter sp. UBA4297]|uniref:hypothetical protein n=1 Tax=Fibrobacter sp. UBA4297 TaxID=1946536 RepID=UPI0025C4EF57|nr:hypothetical protein [Fibrobacter sp. UBA4297]